MPTIVKINTLLLLTILLGCAAGSANKPASDGTDLAQALPDHAQVYALQFAKSGEFPYFGQPKDSSGGPQAGGNMMYPGYNAGGFLAAILLHAAIQGGVNSSQENRRQAEADAVLTPYRDEIARVTAESVFPAVQQRLHTSDEYEYRFDPEASNALQIVVQPAFIMTSSADALGVAADLAVYSPGKALGDPLYRQHIYVQDHASALKRDWTGEDASGLFATSTRLIHDAVLIGLDHYNGLLDTSAQPEQTIRYLENGRKQVERGHLIGYRDGRVLFFTLAQEIKAVPELLED